MQSTATTVTEYIEQLPEERKEPVMKLTETVSENLPKGFQETMGYGMIAFVVPHVLYPGGYHCDPKLPLPFINIASQKNFIALYHMGLYANPELLQWFTEEYPKHCTTKPDMGKSCIRFKKPEQIPYELIARLSQKVSVDEWIDIYEKNYKR